MKPLLDLEIPHTCQDSARYFTLYRMGFLIFIPSQLLTYLVDGPIGIICEVYRTLKEMKGEFWVSGGSSLRGKRT
jgi:hypothetical protein